MEPGGLVHITVSFSPCHSSLEVSDDANAVLHSCLVLFSCLLVHIHTARATNAAGFDLDKVTAIEDALQKGVEAKSKILNTYRKPDRTQGMLGHLLKIARAVITDIRSSDETRTDTVTQDSSHLDPTRIGLADSHKNLNMNNNILPQEYQHTYTHSWPVSSDDTTQYAAGRSNNDNMQNLLWDSWGIAGGWNDIDLGFEDIVTF